MTPSTSAELEPRVDEEVRAALAGRRIRAARQRLEQAHHGRADRYDAPAGRLGRRDPLTRTVGHDKGLAVQTLALQHPSCQRLEGAQTHVQRDVEDLHAGGTQPLAPGRQ